MLLDVRGGSLLASNLAGVRIWQLLERRSTPDGIARTLADEYDIPLDQARADVSAFLDALIARQLIVPEGAP